MANDSSSSSSSSSNSSSFFWSTPPPLLPPILLQQLQATQEHVNNALESLWTSSTTTTTSNNNAPPRPPPPTTNNYTTARFQQQLCPRNFMASSSTNAAYNNANSVVALSILVLIQAALMAQQQQQQQQQQQRLEGRRDDDQNNSSNNNNTSDKNNRAAAVTTGASLLGSSTALQLPTTATQYLSNLSSRDLSLFWADAAARSTALANNVNNYSPLFTSLLSGSSGFSWNDNRTAMESSGGSAGGSGAGGLLFGPSAAADDSSSSSSEQQQPRPMARMSLARRSATVAGQIAQASEKGVTLESKYKVNWRRPLGEGTFGAVYPGTNRATGEHVAVKKISKQCTDQVVFQNEMTALLELRKHGGHPNICGLHASFDSDDGHYYLVLDLIAGGELFNHLCEQGPYSEADAARLVREVASAMNFMHGLGLVHGDLKPENLMLSTKEKASAVVKIVDFGCAQILPPEPKKKKKKSSATSALTSAFSWGKDSDYSDDDDDDNEEDLLALSRVAARGTALTPAYSAPEVLKKKQEQQQEKERLKAEGINVSVNTAVPLEPSFDMWALGVILYILLTAVHPFDLTGASTDEEIEKAIVSGKRPPLGDSPMLSHLSKDAIQVIEQLLQWDPKQRLTAQELLENPWVRGETARTQKIAGSDKRLSAYRAFQTKLQAKAFAGMVQLSTGKNMDLGEDETPVVPTDKSSSSSLLSRSGSGGHGQKPTIRAHGSGGGAGTGVSSDNSVAKRTSLIERAFQMFDPDHRGYIPAKELRKLVGDRADGDPNSDGLVGDLSLSGFSDILSEHMKNKYFPKGHVIYNEGEIGNAMFFLNSGTIEIYTKDGYRAVRQAGEFFGEGALLNPNKTRSASIRCLTPIHAIEISREYFEKYIASDQGVKLNLREKDKARKRQRAKVLLQLQKNMVEKSFKRGDYLFRKGEDGNELFLIDEGKVVLNTGEQDIIYVGKGEMTGEHSFVFGSKRNVNAICCEDECKVFVMKARDFYRLLDSHPSFKESIREICLRREFQKALCAKTRQSFPQTEAALREAFNFVDSKQTGAIELDEITVLLKDFDPTYTEQDIKDILDALDLDETGSVNWEEFQRIFGMDDPNQSPTAENGNQNSKRRKRKKWKR
ncbi:hypothetical protein ACA910_001425 [Epithemia clementina (nom. ined.)]